MRVLRSLVCFGAGATGLGIAGRVVLSFSSMPYHVAKLAEMAFLARLVAGFLLAIAAIVVGVSAKVPFGRARNLYLVAAACLLLSASSIAMTGLHFIRGMSARIGL